MLNIKKENIKFFIVIFFFYSLNYIYKLFIYNYISYFFALKKSNNLFYININYYYYLFDLKNYIQFFF